MLFKRAMLDRIEKGEVTLAFRRWKRPTVQAEGRLRTAIGVLRIGKVERIDDEAIDAKDAVSAGCADQDAARISLANHGGDIYRVEIIGIEPDARVTLRENVNPEEAELTMIRTFLEGPNGTARYLRILEAVGKDAARPAGEIASRLGLEKETFKRDVRKLKELGLTESLDVGYRLSPRGQAALRDRKQKT